MKCPRLSTKGRMVLLVGILLGLTLTLCAKDRTLEDLTGMDWIKWSQEEKTIFVSGYVLCALAMDAFGIFDVVLPEPFWKSLLSTPISILVRQLDWFFLDPANDEWPLVAAIAIRNERSQNGKP